MLIALLRLTHLIVAPVNLVFTRLHVPQAHVRGNEHDDGPSHGRDAGGDGLALRLRPEAVG